MTITALGQIQDLGEWWNGRLLSMAALLLLLIFLARLAIGRLNRAEERQGERQTRLRWNRFALARLGVIVAVSVTVAVLLSLVEPWVVVVVLGLLALLLGIGAIDLAPNLLAGVVVAVQRPVRVGDRVRIGIHEGLVAAVGLRSTQLVARDGSRLLIPNRQLLRETVRETMVPGIGAPILIRYTLPITSDLASAKLVAYHAACVSKYASLRRRPEVHVTATGLNELQLEIEVYAFDPDFAEHLRSDIVEQINEGLQAKKGSEE